MISEGSILQMARGQIQEQVDNEVKKVIKNILDVRTDPCEKRKITLTIEMKPDENREYIKITAKAKSQLAPDVSVGTTIGIASDPRTGEMIFVESTPQVPGQVSMDGTMQEEPKYLSIANIE